MLSYEGGLRGWGGMSDTHIRSDPFFAELRKRGVHFYDDSAVATPLFTVKPDALEKHNVQNLAALLALEDLDDVFEYEDEEDFYGSPIEEEDDLL